ncbi:hypothetical protein P3S68_027892 [Capsicum galapagoense]
MEPLLNSYTAKSTTATGFLLFVPFEEHIILIANIHESPSHFLRNWSLIKFYCTIYRRPTHLKSRCQFDITVRDDTGSTIATISEKIGEELLRLTAAEIYDIPFTKNQLLPLLPVQHKLRGKIFTLQVKRLGETVRKKSRYIFSEIVHHVNHR